MLRSLQDIGSKYTVFEDNQVLTAKQLNEVVEYLDEQARLTRVELVGVGIVCGLHVSLEGETVRLSSGVGVTTDGDLLYALTDTVFGAFRSRDPNAPSYDKLGTVAMWELVPTGTEGASPLGQFGGLTSNPLSEMTAFLLMEEYEKDPDLCSNTNCDNRGKTRAHNIKLLLINKRSSEKLSEDFYTADVAARSLDEVVADRPVLAGVATLTQMVAAYKNANASILAKLKTALTKIHRICKPFFPDVYRADPADEWTEKLQRIVQEHASASSGVQYTHDFLLDVVETQNALRDQLFGDTSICCPDLQAFPKHLLLGDLAGPDVGASSRRTGYYPSRQQGASRAKLGHARFLFRKIGVLIEGFNLPGNPTPIKITPSLGLDRSLEERAIPYYYDVNQVVHRWHHVLDQRGMNAYNYSYHANSYGAQGGAADPLSVQIGRFSFFRIEGHLGGQIKAVMRALEDEIKSRNLPIALNSVLLEEDRRKIIPFWPRPYTDLHRIHRLLRYSLADQLDDIADYAAQLKKQVDAASIEEEHRDIKSLVDTRHASVKSRAAAMVNKLRKKFTDFQSETEWSAELGRAQEAAGELKLVTSPVAKSEFAGPLDSLLASTHAGLLGRLGEIIAGMEAKADDGQLFKTFHANHPGLEHSAGVSRGGTFVVAYDKDGNVVGDFMLPYFCASPEDPEEEEPPVIKPRRTWPDSLIERALTFDLSIDGRIRDKLDGFWREKDPIIRERFALQKELIKDYKDILLSKPVVGPIGRGLDWKVADPLLGLHVDELKVNNEKVNFLRTRLLDPQRTREQIEKDQAALKVAETELAGAMVKAAEQVKDVNDVSAGSDAFVLMQALGESAQKIKDPEVRERVARNLGAVGASPAVRTMLSSIVRR